jgi:hypothetical protein
MKFKNIFLVFEISLRCAFYSTLFLEPEFTSCMSSTEFSFRRFYMLFIVFICILFMGLIFLNTKNLVKPSNLTIKPSITKKKIVKGNNLKIFYC